MRGLRFEPARHYILHRRRSHRGLGSRRIHAEGRFRRRAGDVAGEGAAQNRRARDAQRADERERSLARADGTGNELSHRLCLRGVCARAASRADPSGPVRAVVQGLPRLHTRPRRRRAVRVRGARRAVRRAAAVPVAGAARRTRRHRRRAAPREPEDATREAVTAGESTSSTSTTSTSSGRATFGCRWPIRAVSSRSPLRPSGETGSAAAARLHAGCNPGGTSRPFPHRPDARRDLPPDVARPQHHDDHDVPLGSAIVPCRAAVVLRPVKRLRQAARS